MPVSHRKAPAARQAQIRTLLTALGFNSGDFVDFNVLEHGNSNNKVCDIVIRDA